MSSGSSRSIWAALLIPKAVYCQFFWRVTKGVHNLHKIALLSLVSLPWIHIICKFDLVQSLMSLGYHNGVQATSCPPPIIKRREGGVLPLAVPFDILGPENSHWHEKAVLWKVVSRSAVTICNHVINQEFWVVSLIQRRDQERLRSLSIRMK